MNNKIKVYHVKSGLNWANKIINESGEIWIVDEETDQVRAVFIDGNLRCEIIPFPGCNQDSTIGVA